MKEEHRGDENVEILSSPRNLRQITSAVRLVARRTFTPLTVEPMQEPGRLAKDVVRYMLKNYPHDVSLKELSHKVGLSRFHMVREFRRMTGITPGALLKRVRVVKAMDLLLESKLRIKHIAREVGYTDSGAFCRAFHATAGTSPSMYRLTRQWPSRADEKANKNAKGETGGIGDAKRDTAHGGEQRVPWSEVIAHSGLSNATGTGPSA